ncbi:hypothetical protein [uncultured Oscillibacter sp.]|uniref:hypothetical protein n=1 Tax=uncultured Oscillibacter sp. TaxID=876091 RepID=UPI0025D4D8A4|nr:hypothetical protein [uncultured Oscillibacter sp.]
MNNEQSHCGSCGGGACGVGGGCDGCSGCSARASVWMGEGELELLQDLAQTPFLPIARREGAEEPIYLEGARYTPAEYGQIITSLAQKRLVRLDYDLPLSNFDYTAYEGFPHKGSMALTAAGQHALELLEIQGASEE